MLDDILVVSGQVHRPIFDNKYSPDQAITKASFLDKQTRKLVVVFLPWHVPEWYAKKLQQKLACLRQASLIYYFNESIIATNTESVVSSFEYIALSIASDVNELSHRYGYTHIDLLGISLGNVAMCITAEKLKHFNKVIMLVPGDSLADPLWFGWRTRRLRHKLQRSGTTLTRLQKQWDILAPSSHVSTLRGHGVHIILAKRDRFIPYDFGRQLVRDLLAAHASVTFTESPFGHIATILAYLPDL